jgi:hypothetical protein
MSDVFVRVTRPVSDAPEVRGSVAWLTPTESTLEVYSWPYYPDGWGVRLVTVGTARRGSRAPGAHYAVEVCADGSGLPAWAPFTAADVIRVLAAAKALSCEPDGATS